MFERKTKMEQYEELSFMWDDTKGTKDMLRKAQEMVDTGFSTGVSLRFYFPGDHWLIVEAQWADGPPVPKAVWSEPSIDGREGKRWRVTLRRMIDGMGWAMTAEVVK